MKKFFENRNSVLSVSTVLLVLLVMVAVSHYYLQYETNSIKWIYLLGSLFLLGISLITLLYSISNKKENIKFLSIGILSYSTLMLVFSAMNFGLYTAHYVKAAALMLPLVFLPCYIDKDIFEKPLIKNKIYLIIAVILSVAALILAYINILEPAGVLYKIYYAIGILFSLFGMVLGIINIRKKINETYAYTLCFYCFTSIFMFVLRMFNRFTPADKFLSIYAVGAALILIFAVSAVKVSVNKNKKFY